jgi:ankyrin repeat protein
VPRHARRGTVRMGQKFPLNNRASGNFNHEILTLLSKQDKIGWRLLHWAAFYGHERVVQRLLKKGADVAGKGRPVLGSYERT